MSTNLQAKLAIEKKRLDELNTYLLNPDNKLIQEFLSIVDSYGTPKEINKKAQEARKVEYILERLGKKHSPYTQDLEWLQTQKEKKAFITIDEFRTQVLGKQPAPPKVSDDFAVTLEISACQYFPDFMKEAHQAVERGELMPGRFIRVRKMKEQEEDNDLLAMTAAMQIIGASWCETLDTKGTDGSNIHLGGPETITGYFGGVGQPNDYPLKWIDEFLYYYTNYGVKQVLNVNPGTIFLAYLLHKIGIDIEFKISVYMGNDNPYAVLWTLLAARLFSREDGASSLIGFNFSNSVNTTTIEMSSDIRKALGLEDIVRFEHHILETWKSIVIQPYDRRKDFLYLAPKVKNISAKHEGAEIEVDSKREHPTDILDYFLPKTDIEAKGWKDYLTQNYLDKHAAINNTARILTQHGIPFIAAHHLHHRG